MTNWSELSINHYKFILEQGEKKLAETIDTKKSHRLRSYKQFYLCLSAISASVGVIFDSSKSDFHVFAVLIIIICIYSVWHLKKMLILFEVHVNGNNPKHYMDLNKYDDSFTPELIEKSTIYSEIKNIENKIDLNTKDNDDAIPSISKSYYSLCLIIPVCIIYVFSLL